MTDAEGATAKLCSVSKGDIAVSLTDNETDNGLVSTNTPRSNINGSFDLGCPAVPNKRASITYGFATSSSYVHRKALSSRESDALTGDETTEQEDDTMSDVIFIASSGTDILPENCVRSIGAQADKFLQNLPLRHFERLRKFIEANEPKDSEQYVWIRDNTTSQVTVMSLETVMEHIKKASTVKRVKWRHLSLDRITVYRYSVPSIASTKQCMRLAFCVRTHQRYLLLVLWLTIVLLLTVSLILGSHYSSSAETNSTNAALNVSQYFTRY
ncbi:hypothetical protein Tcan_07916 [Toxocara canis]|uniref:Uncharacterized protein n=1 Tax=Toxocara canis TaxID=6265 RepID=A0A0B2VNE6_TOXCA|nr:hypothetical protein Tcan_07916 [Toxocara canis]